LTVPRVRVTTWSVGVKAVFPNERKVRVQCDAHSIVTRYLERHALVVCTEDWLEIVVLDQILYFFD